MINVILFQMVFYNRNKFLLSFFIFLFIVPFLVGYLLYSNINNYINNNGNHLVVSLLQPNLHLFDKRDTGKAKQITSDLVNTSNQKYITSDLVVWPESSYPYYIDLDIEIFTHFEQHTK